MLNAVTSGAPDADNHSPLLALPAARDLLDALPDAVLLVASDGTVWYANSAAAQLFGRKVEVLIGSALGLPIGSAEPSNLQVIRLSLPDGTERMAEFHAVQLNDAGLTLASLRDVTERNDLQQRLRQSEKMEAVGRLAGGVAHDFNNMLTAVFGYTSTAAARVSTFPDVPQGEKQQIGEDLDQIRRAAGAAQRLTRQLLSLSSRHRPPSGSCDIGDVLTQHKRIYEAACGGMLRLELDIEHGLPDVAAGPEIIDQILLNLAVNARDAVISESVVGDPTLPPSKNVADGRLEVFVRQRKSRRGRRGGNRWIELCVIDHGPGVPQEVRPHIFEPFYTTKSDGKGSGLGLSTVYGIIKRLGGDVELHDTPGGGATFCITLPAKLNKATVQPTVRPPHAEATDGDNRLIILAEDQVAIRKLLARLLRARGYIVQTAADGTEAIRRLEAAAVPGTAQPAILLSDVAMPGLTGFQVASRARAMFPDLPIILMSGYTDGDLQSAMGKLEDISAMPEDYFFLQKPFEPAELDRIIQQLTPVTD